MLCRSFRSDQILYLFLLFPSVNFRLSISSKADRSLMWSAWNQRFLFPTSLQVTLWPVAGRLQPTPESPLLSNNTQNRKSQTKVGVQPTAFCHCRNRSSNLSLGVLVHCLSLLSACKYGVGTMPDAKDPLLSVRPFTD